MSRFKVIYTGMMGGSLTGEDSGEKEAMLLAGEPSGIAGFIPAKKLAHLNLFPLEICVTNSSCRKMLSQVVV